MMAAVLWFAAAAVMHSVALGFLPLLDQAPPKDGPNRAWVIYGALAGITLALLLGAIAALLVGFVWLLQAIATIGG